MKQGPADTGSLTAIRRQFPGWRLWRSDEGRFWATRVGDEPRPPGRWAKTVDGDTPSELLKAIAEQERRIDSG